ncbi:5-formyltetrahydrofolate cyclo-ligase [Barnesiella sp. An55]|uniref:5-formyltetrahydrofolate cyclo-ligase n=1 Tax=Barnesiella sp. An55 TaxID=1965646 RepID=UPI000B369C3E|nr:5-formyltetrahydrofolate cyclo-ligase [Barnesiella sp. An55]OUN70556.1 5-formyltetrahydrofolate cyclo-ligase [Barnesiella sp. An55]HIZ26994.1 5-formyltetrahydrofolate cyclo-ligase [Candidatus Barnesiella merdipullorum]
MHDKRQLRQEIKQLKRALTPAERESLSQRICAAVESLPGFDRVSHLMLYHALPDEVDTQWLLSRWSETKQLYLPVVNGDDIVVARYGRGPVRQGAYGIWEPADATAIDPSQLEWIVVPGVAFDRAMNRLGRGKGYYDRLLQQISARKIGICYGLQLLDEIPAEPHDIKMDLIVTENNIIYKDNELWH